MKNLITRTLTGIVFVAIILGAICYHPLTFLALFSVITGLVMWEFYGLTNAGDNTRYKRVVACVAGVYLFAASFLYAHDMTGLHIFIPYLLYLIYCLILELYTKAEDPLRNWALAFFAQLYCAGSFAMINYIAAIPDMPGEMVHAPLHVICIFVFVWVNDTGAYLTGCTLGRHKLFERISPKKSWEGFWGGLIITLLSSQIFYYFAPEIGRWHWLGLTLVIVLFGTFGDLIESLLKRSVGVKDSGVVFPGHGGALDRFDSLILAIPAAFIYFELFIR
ncbi:phosphatidate cytidylyltransferase [Parabacteroides sp. OttesenSCG-928-N08]|nr:phosphatidate cytidylyltransferase [Parabacteroides sp. OttesenSCG-928-N08]